jgi:hypothetical protein
MQSLLAVLKDLTPVGAVIVFAWGVFQFYRSTELSFRKPYWEKLLALYVDACSCAAAMGTTTSEAEWNAARATFWKLYYGPLCLVEDQKVEEAMVELGTVLESMTFESRMPNVLTSLSLELAYACRNSIRNDWRVPLEFLMGQKSRSEA